MAFVTPLRYPGGKGRLGLWLEKLIAANGLEGGTYIEPYAGGAGAAMHLLLRGTVKRIVINDIDPLIYSFWWAVFNKPAELARRVKDAKVTLAERERAKEIVRSCTENDPIDVAFSTFFLNRTSRSGIITGGPIGGREQLGKYRLNARYNATGLADRIESLGRLRHRVSLHNRDAMSLLRRISARPPKKALVYCDPPYYVKGYQLYENHYTAKDHAEISCMMQRLNLPWLVTYDNCPAIKALYESTASTTFSLHYSTHLTRKRNTELLFFQNLNLNPLPFLHR